MSSQHQHSPRQDEPSDLPQVAADALRRALLGRGHEAPGGAEGELQQAMRALAAAQARGTRAEELVVVLRQAWAGLPEVRSLVPASQRTEAVARAVTVCIREYYAGVNASQRPVAGVPPDGARPPFLMPDS